MRVLDIIAYIEDNRSLYRGPDMTIDLIPTPVSVTAHHLAHGRRFRCYACPLALAVDDLLIEGYSAVVSPPELAILDMVYSNHDEERNEVVIILPPDAIQFVKDFDDERPVSPKVFTIPLPRHLLRHPPPLPSAADIDPGRHTPHPRDVPRP